MRVRWLGVKRDWQRGRQGQGAVLVGGGRAWPDNESTRRAKLAARTASGRTAAHGRTKQPGPTSQARRRAEHQRSRKHHRGPGKPPLLSAAAGLGASRVVDEARHVALEEGGDGRGRAGSVLGDDDVGLAGAVFLVVVVGAV